MSFYAHSAQPWRRPRPAEAELVAFSPRAYMELGRDLALAFLDFFAAGPAAPETPAAAVDKGRG